MKFSSWTILQSDKIFHLQNSPKWQNFPLIKFQIDMAEYTKF